jgi:exonuclease SbcC
MIPIQLTFKGLYSYAKSVTIDFEPLVAARLFGIFGPVGSGKSAILEAIMFVLFDRTTRLNKVGDDRYYNMMNLQTNEMCIDFIFKGGLNNNTKYRFYFLARRNSRDFEKVEVKDRSYYQWTKSDWKPMETSEVLGMTYENFMQTVIIPQGRFRQFIDQKPTARTDMLKELFHLDRFDIAQQAFQMLSTVKEEYHYVEGQLSQFEEINNSLLKKLKKEIDLYQKQIEQHSKTEHSLTTRNNQLQ